jgi:hypothetical protein
MNVSAFFEHWGIEENPFRAEEARQDSVFARLGVGPTNHPDFEKIVGDLSRPSTSIVFGEKGSGKTAIRLQLARSARDFNEKRQRGRVFLVPYDDLNPVLDRFLDATIESRRGSSKRKESRGEERHTLDALKRLRLVDHMDAILQIGVTRLVDALLGSHGEETEGGEDDRLRIGEENVKSLRRSEQSLKRDLMALQAVYDASIRASDRSADLQSRVGARRDRRTRLWRVGAMLGWILPVGVMAAFVWLGTDQISQDQWLILLAIALGVWALVLVKRLVLDRWRLKGLASKIARQVRVSPRSVESVADALDRVHVDHRRAVYLPTTDSDEPRYEMFQKLRAALDALGFSSLLVVMDRIDEPTVVAGEAERMRAIIWPMLNNKFLQMDGVGFKLLLPIELRHALFRETSAFFQEARLDKHNLIERLTWTGATLYDLCSERLRACLAAGGDGEISLVDLFEEDVSRTDIVDALDQMSQPRDAFKFLYQCVQEHCSNLPQEQANYRIPRLILETVRRQQSDRVQGLFRGVRPA